MAANFDLCEELQTTPEKTNYARLCRLLIDGGTKALRKLFDSIHPPNTLANVLAQNNNKLCLNKLKPQIINQKEWNMLYPMTGTPSSMNFDISLLTVLLRNICNLRQPKTGWDNLPRPTDLSKEADIVRIKFYRNKLCHGKTTNLSDQHFHGYWNEIANALKRLGAKEDDIDKLKAISSMDSKLQQQYIDDVAAWKYKEEEAEDMIQTILKVVNLSDADKIYCDKHKNDHLSMYCERCVKVICSVCETIEHRDHTKKEIDTAAKIWRGGIMRYVIPQCERKLGITEKSFQRAKMASKFTACDFEAKREEIQSRIHQHDKQKMLTEKLKSHYNKLQSDVDDQMHVLENNVTVLSKSLKYFRTVSLLENDAKLLKECPTLQDHFKQICNEKIDGDDLNQQLFEILMHANSNYLEEKCYFSDAIVELRYSNSDLHFPAHPKYSSLEDKESQYPLKNYDELKFAIHTKNYYGDPVYEMKGLEACLKYSDGSILNLEVESMMRQQSSACTATHTVSFQVVQPGVHQVSVKVYGEEICGSPHTIHVAPYVNHRKITYLDENTKFPSKPFIAAGIQNNVLLSFTKELATLHVFDQDLKKEKSLSITLKCGNCIPSDIILSPNNTCLIACHCPSHPLCEYDLDGKFLQSIGEGKVENAYHLALNSKTNMLYVTTRDAGIVHILQICDGFYKYMRSFKGKFSDVYLIAINSNGHIVLVPTSLSFGPIQNFAIEIWSGDGSCCHSHNTLSMTYLRTKKIAWYASEESNKKTFVDDYIEYFTIDRNDNMYLYIPSLFNLQKIQNVGEYLCPLPSTEGLYVGGLATTNGTAQEILSVDWEYIHCFEEA